MINGIILVDKPQGVTSFKVVSIIKKLFQTKKVGHAGTLDPLATGLLPILLNKATKIQDMIQNENKEYVAEFKLGIVTDTQDITGKIIKTADKINITKNMLDDALNKFTGDVYQTPPMYSAISKNGVRLYKLARKGIEIERSQRKVSIYKLDLLEFDQLTNICKILVKCSKGTYIRTLCSDIGNALGCGATLINLRRTATCNFTIKNSVTIGRLEKLKENNSLEDAVIPIEKVFEYYPKVVLNENLEKMFRNGKKIKFALNCVEHIVCVFNKANILLGLGLYNVKSREISVYKMLA